MNDEEKKQLEHIKDDLVKLSTELATDEKRPAEERISLLMAKIRTEPDIETFSAARATIDEMEDSDLKLRAAMDLIEEIEVATGNVRSSEDSHEDTPHENEQQDQHEHLVPSPHHEEHDEHHS